MVLLVLSSCMSLKYSLITQDLFLHELGQLICCRGFLAAAHLAQKAFLTFAKEAALKGSALAALQLQLTCRGSYKSHAANRLSIGGSLLTSDRQPQYMARWVDTTMSPVMSMGTGRPG